MSKMCGAWLAMRLPPVSRPLPEQVSAIAIDIPAKRPELCRLYVTEHRQHPQPIACHRDGNVLSEPA